MSYHNLSSSSLSTDERQEEAQRICKMLDDYADELKQNEVNLVVTVENGGAVSVKMLFWLRDIKDRVMG